MPGDRPSLLIRDATPEDWDSIWPFFHRIVAAGETYAYDREMDGPRAVADGHCAST
jgi:hypothetical protein